MRVIALGLFLVLVSVPTWADEPAWKIDLRQRAIRRADSTENAARRAAWIARGRPGEPPANTNVVEGSYDPTILAPIELIQHVSPVFNLERSRQEKFRREWASLGAAELLGKDYWERLRVVLAPAIFDDYEMRRRHALSPEEARSLKAMNDATAATDQAGCQPEAEGLKAGRATWGEAFDRFLYEVVAPGVYFWSSCSDDTLYADPEFWLDEWRWQEEGCQ